MKFKGSCGRRCVLQNLANITRRGIQRKRPGIPREISRSEGYPPVLFSASSERAQNCVPCQVQGGEVLLRGGRGLGCAEQTRKTTERRKRGGAGGWGWSPSPQPAPAFPNRPAARRKHPELMRPGPAHPTPTRALRRAASGGGTPLAGEGLCARVIPAPAALEPAVEGGSAAGTARVTRSRTCARAPSLAPGSGRTRRAPGKPPAGVPRM